MSYRVNLSKGSVKPYKINIKKNNEIVFVHTYEQLIGAEIRRIPDRVEQEKCYAILSHHELIRAFKEGKMCIRDRYNHLLKENKNLEIIQFIYKYPIQIIVLLCTFFLGLSMIFYYKSQHKSLKKGFREKEIYELNLQRALIRAEHANAAKTDFLSRMSHEIRTPIGAIIGFNEKAEQNIEDKEKVLDCIQKIKVSSNHLLQLINDILDMTKVSAGKMELNIQPINIMKMMQSVQVVYEEIARKNEISFTVDIDTDLDLSLIHI